jgi:peptide/nickel transport system permease protein
VTEQSAEPATSTDPSAPSAHTAGLRTAVRRAASSGSLLIGGTITAAFLLVALVSLVWTPYPVAEVSVPDKLQPPSAEHWLGTNQFGRDVLSLLMVGAQNSIVVGVVAVGIGVVIGCALGTAAAARGGWLEELVMRLADFTFAFPFLLSAILITALLGPGAVNSMIAIGIFNVPVFARLSRASALSIWQRDYVLAAQLAGKRAASITWEHVLPNIASVIIVQATIQFALAILGEAALSYLGLGTQPPTPSWGRMLKDAQTFIYNAPLLAVFPGLTIVLTVLGLNLLGDGLRDVLDPRTRRAR